MNLGHEIDKKVWEYLKRMIAKYHVEVSIATTISVLLLYHIMVYSKIRTLSAFDLSLYIVLIYMIGLMHVQLQRTIVAVLKVIWRKS